MDGKTSKKKPGKTDRTGHHRLGFWVSVVTGVLAVFIMIILTLLPLAMEWGAERMLLSFGAKTATISDIDFNPITGSLSVHDLQVAGLDADRASMERLTVKVDLFPVFRKRIRFRKISLTGLSLDIRQFEDGSVTIGGLSIPEKGEAEQLETEVESAASPWGLGLGTLDVKRLTVHLITPSIDDTVVLKHLSLENIETWTPEKSGDYALKADFLGGTVAMEGTTRPFIESMQVSTRIKLEELSLERLTPYIKNTPVRSLSGSLSGQGTVNATLSLQSTLAVASTVQFDFSARDIFLQTATEGLELELHPGALDLDISLDSTINTGNGASKEANFAVTTTLEGTTLRLASDKADLEVLQDAFSAQISGSYSGTGSVDLSRLSVNAGLSLQGLVLKGIDGQAELVQLGSLDIEGIEIDGPDNIRTALIRAGDTVLLARQSKSVSKGEPTQILALKNLEVSGTSLSDRTHLSVGTVQMDSLNTWILREEEGVLEAQRILQGIMNNPTMSAAADTPAVDAGDKESHPEDNLVVDVEEFSLTGENSLTFRDLSVNPPFDVNVDLLNARILKLSSGEKEALTDITINAGMGKYSALSVNGTVRPSRDTPDVELHVQLKAIELPTLTPYSKKYLGYIMRSGRLDTEMDILVKKGILDSQAVISVNRIEVEEVGEEQRTEEYLDIPVKTALSMLKDKKGDINLTLPIQGDLKDPEFNIRQVVTAATSQALKKGATIYYKDLGVTLLSGGLIPPGAFTLGGKLFEDTTTMKFQPVEFSPLSRKLTKPAKEYLDLMAEKLGEKPKVRLVLCGMIAMEDIDSLRQEDTDTDPVDDSAKGSIEGSSTEGSTDAAEETEPSDVPAVEKVPLNNYEKEHLFEIARQRALAVKDHLSELGGIDSERLFICNPDVELVEKGLPPRVDLLI